MSGIRLWRSENIYFGVSATNDRFVCNCICETATIEKKVRKCKFGKTGKESLRFYILMCIFNEVSVKENCEKFSQIQSNVVLLMKSTHAVMKIFCHFTFFYNKNSFLVFIFIRICELICEFLSRFIRTDNIQIIFFINHIVLCLKWV